MLRSILASLPPAASRCPVGSSTRPDLPLASAQAEAVSVRCEFGNSIRWLCLRHGIGPGHKDWPELSRAIVAFGGSLEGFRVGAPPCGLQWWESPGVVPGIVTGFGAPTAARQPQRCWSSRLLRLFRRRRRTPCQPKPRMQGCLRHGWPRLGSTFLPVPAPVRRPGRRAARDCSHCHV